MSILLRCLGIAVSLTLFLSCSTPPPRVQGELSTELTYEVPVMNAKDMMDKPTVVIVSIDGYRADYNSLFNPPNLTGLERTGVSAKGLKPCYPSKTFPSHFSIATGMTPAHHGIVSNEFYDQKEKRSFAVSDVRAVRDGSWYQADPIWVLAERAGLRTAVYFWIGSEANIDEAHPNYYYNYAETTPDQARVDRALQWLKLTPELRPHLIMLYFSGVDAAAHHFGTQSHQMREAINDIDVQIGRLREGLKGSPNTNLIVVSDHGMADVDPKKVALIDESAEVQGLLKKFKTTGRGPQMQFYLNEGEDHVNVSKMRSALERYARSSGKPLHVVTMPKEFASLKYGPTSRTGDLVLDPELPWLVGTRQSPPVATGANHGWNPKLPIMHGILFAEGPAFKKHAILSTVDNVSVAPLALKVLGVPIPKNLDGTLSAVKGAINGE